MFSIYEEKRWWTTGHWRLWGHVEATAECSSRTFCWNKSLFVLSTCSYNDWRWYWFWFIQLVESFWLAVLWASYTTVQKLRVCTIFLCFWKKFLMLTEAAVRVIFSFPVFCACFFCSSFPACVNYHVCRLGYWFSYTCGSFHWLVWLCI